jgi:hypothetical protein
MEIGESLVGAYLEHIRGCQVVVYNTHLSDEQGELDVIGIKTLSTGKQEIWLVEAATHTNGLDYGGQAKSVKKIEAKRDRALKFAQKLFKGATLRFEVWSPIVSSGIVDKLKELSIGLVANADYTDRVNELALHASKSTKTTGNDTYRTLQLLTHLRGAKPKFAVETKPVVAMSKESAKQTDAKAYLVVAKNEKGAVVSSGYVAASNLSLAKRVFIAEGWSVTATEVAIKDLPGDIKKQLLKG